MKHPAQRHSIDDAVVDVSIANCRIGLKCRGLSGGRILSCHAATRGRHDEGHRREAHWGSFLQYEDTQQQSQNGFGAEYKDVSDANVATAQNSANTPVVGAAG